MDPLRTISTRVTPQSEPADARQAPNSAGGDTFQPDEVPHVVVHIEPKATLPDLKAQALQQAAQNEPQAA